MKRVAREKGFPFPYYGFDAALELRHHGRFDGLLEEEQIPSVGCSIKWRK